MSRYINMDDVITYPVMPVEYRKYQTMNLDDAYEQGWDDLQTLIEKMPTADVRENVHGEWIADVAYYDEEGCPCIVTRCNQCGEPWTVSNFCPSCGADMRKGETNGFD